MNRALFLVLIAFALAACGHEDSPPSDRAEPTRAPMASPTSNPDFSTWVAPGDWVRLRECRVYEVPPRRKYRDAGTPCKMQHAVGRIVDGPFGNGEDFPYYEVEGVGWMSETSLTTPVDSISFVDTNHGWALIEVGGDAETSIHELWETKDGGDSWGRIAELELVAAFPPRFGFTDDSRGWIVSGPYNDATILESTDAGRTWNPIWQSTEPYGNDFQSYSVVDASHGWRSGGSGMPAHLERTLDGGRTWVDLAYPPCGTERRVISWVGFVDANVGFLLCGQEGNADLFRTSDGGVTWVQLDTRVTIEWIITGMTFLDESRGWITTSWEEAEGGIFTTLDGGITWQEMPLESPDKPPFWRFEQPEFVDETHGWMIISRDNTTPGNLYRTIDGGKTWEQSTPPGELLSP